MHRVQQQDSVGPVASGEKPGLSRRSFFAAGAAAAATTALVPSTFAQTQGFAVGPEEIR